MADVRDIDTAGIAQNVAKRLSVDVTFKFEITVASYATESDIDDALAAVRKNMIEAINEKTKFNG